MDIPRLTRKEFSILGLLIDRGEMYGLQLVRESSELKRGTIYVTLNRMGKKGYVTSRQVKSKHEAGLPRRLYSPTGHGARVFSAWQMARTKLAEDLP